MKAWLTKTKRLLGETHTSVLVAALLILGSVWGFLTLSSEMLEGDLSGFDSAILEFFRKPGDAGVLIGPSWLQGWANDFTALGSGPVLWLFSLLVVGFLLVSRSWIHAGFVATATAGGGLLNLVLKATFARPRPIVVPHLVEVDSLSFPSAHAMAAAIVYLTLGVLLAGMMSDRVRRLYTLAATFLIVFVIGLTRVVLGVHYPSDVLAGWAIGVGWALLCWLAWRAIRERFREEVDRREGAFAATHQAS